MPRMRTIKGIVAYFKEKDAESGITEHFVRSLVWENKVRFVRAGSKYLIDVDALEEFLINPPKESFEDGLEYGKLRKIQ